MTERVLVVTVDTQIGLAVAQSLGRKGVEVQGVGIHSRSIGFYSRYVKRNHLLPYWKWQRSEADYINKLITIIRENRITHVMAISEPLILLLNENRVAIEEHARLLVHPAEMLDKVFDKKKTLAAAEQVGVPIPRTLFLDEGQTLERTDALRDFALPLVIKPICRTYMQRRGSAHDFKIKYLYSLDALKESVAELAGYPLMIQEYCEGKGQTLCMHRFNGQVQLMFQYRVIHAYPPLGGFSIYRESAPLDPQACEYGQKLLAALDWDGPCEVEFIRDPSGGLKLMEVNGRFWGALPLAVKAGADFPFLTFQAWARGEAARVEKYRTGLRSCLLGGELNWILAYLKSDRSRKEKLKGFLEFLGTFSPFVRHDVQCLDDPMPGLMDILLITGNFFKGIGILFRKDRKDRIETKV